MTNNFKIEKICQYFSKKIAKIRDFEILINILLHLKKYTVTYFQTLEEVPWLLRLRKPK